MIIYLSKLLDRILNIIYTLKRFNLLPDEDQRLGLNTEKFFKTYQICIYTQNFNILNIVIISFITKKTLVKPTTERKKQNKIKLETKRTFY